MGRERGDGCAGNNGREGREASRGRGVGLRERNGRVQSRASGVNVCVCVRERERRERQGRTLLGFNGWALFDCGVGSRPTGLGV